VSKRARLLCVRVCVCACSYVAVRVHVCMGVCMCMCCVLCVVCCLFCTLCLCMYVPVCVCVCVCVCVFHTSGIPCAQTQFRPDVHLPCDTGPCYESQSEFVVANATVYTAGSEYVYPGWTSATLMQTASFGGGPPPSTFTNLLSTAAPTWPITLPAAMDVLPDPTAVVVDNYPSWLQSYTVGYHVCLTSANMTQFSSVAVVGPAPTDAVPVVVANVSACPLPSGLACFWMMVGHISAFTNA
jgi:hypothetical protein